MQTDKAPTDRSKGKKALLESARQKASIIKVPSKGHKVTVGRKDYSWSTNAEKIAVIREGIPYAAIEEISKRTNIPISHYLDHLEIVQTTYNKKKRSNSIMSKQDSEAIIELTELYDFGLSVFNKEREKFQRWLRRPNISLGGVTPESLFDSLTGINEVRKALNRIEYGNMA